MLVWMLYLSPCWFLFMRGQRLHVYIGADANVHMHPEKERTEDGLKQLGQNSSSLQSQSVEDKTTMLCFRKGRDGSQQITSFRGKCPYLTHSCFNCSWDQLSPALICWRVSKVGGNITRYLFWDSLQGKCSRSLCARKSVCAPMKKQMGIFIPPLINRWAAAPTNKAADDE